MAAGRVPDHSPRVHSGRSPSTRSARRYPRFRFLVVVALPARAGQAAASTVPRELVHRHPAHKFSRELSALTELGPVGITVDVAAPYLQGRSSHAVASRASDQRYVRPLMERHVAGRYERYDLYLTPGDAVVLASYQAAASLGVAGFTGSNIRPR